MGLQGEGRKWPESRELSSMGGGSMVQGGRRYKDEVAQDKRDTQGWR